MEGTERVEGERHGNLSRIKSKKAWEFVKDNFSHEHGEHGITFIELV